MLVYLLRVFADPEGVMTARFDRENAQAALDWLFQPGDVVEVRIPKAKRLKTISGYFNSREKLIDALRSASGEYAAVYYSLNPVSPALLGRANNELKPYAEQTTNDSPGEILRRTNLLIDADPVRPAGISSTDAEFAESKRVIKAVRDDLREHGFPEPLLAMSGNGHHAIYAIDLPNDPASRDLCKRFLEALAEKHDTPTCKIDRKVFNAARITKSYGTFVMKGDATVDRPHRTALVWKPPVRVIVPRELIEAYVGAAKPAGKDEEETPTPKASAEGKRGWTKESVDEHIRAGFSGVKDAMEWKGGWKWQHDCPFDETHKSPDAYTLWSKGEEPHVHCAHNSCADWTQEDFRVKWEEASGKEWPVPDILKELADFGCEIKSPVIAKALKNSADTEEAEEQTEESGLRYPELVPDFDAICYPGSKLRELAEKACAGGNLTGNKPFALSPGFVIPAILTLASAIPREDEMLGTRINLFTCLLSMSRAGKDVSWNRAGAVMGLGKRGESEYWRDYTPGGHSQMVEMLGDTQERQSKGMPKPPLLPGPKKACGITPELSEIIKSSRGESSHMLETFQQFFDSNLHSTRERNTHRKITMNCRFSWGTNLAIGIDRVEEKRFTKVFGDMVNDGFASRFLFGFSETAVDSKDLEEWHPVQEVSRAGSLEDALGGLDRTYAEQLEAHVVTGYGEGVREAYVTAEVNLFPGSAFLFKKAMLVIATINLHEEITMQDFKAALAFIQWQACVRGVFKPSQADDAAQSRFNELLLRAVRRADQRQADLPAGQRWVNVQRLARMNGWALSNVPLGLERTVYALQGYGELDLEPVTDDEGDPIVSKTTGKPAYDWTRVKAVHMRQGCWCVAKSHPKREDDAA
jgi:hypothetical protein